MAAAVIIVTLTLLLIGRLVLLQVVRYDYYAELSQGNRVRIEPLPAPRGLILDRNGEVIASNQPAFQLELVREHVPDLDATLDGLIDLGLLAPDDLRRREARRSARAAPSTACRSGCACPKRTSRASPCTASNSPASTSRRARRAGTRTTISAVHALGYVGRDQRERSRAASTGAAYAGTTLIGKLGVESRVRARSCTARTASAKCS